MLQLVFTKSALKDWEVLDSEVRRRLSAKLFKLLDEEAVRSRLTSHNGQLFKIKITSPQFRLVYRIDLGTKSLIILAVGPRGSIYEDI